MAAARRSPSRCTPPTRARRPRTDRAQYPRCDLNPCEEPPSEFGPRPAAKFLEFSPAGRRSDQPRATQKNERSVCALFACAMVNVCFPTDETKVVASAAAAFAVRGNRNTAERGAQFGALTTVDAAPAASVTDPVAFDRPAANC